MLALRWRYCAGAVAGRGGAVVGGDRTSTTKPMNPSKIFRHYLIGAGDDETQVQVVPVAAAPPSRKPKTIAGDAAAMAKRSQLVKQSPLSNTLKIDNYVER